MTLIGERLGNIRIVEKLGEGGMGEIYRGFDETLERHVAIKSIQGEKQLDEDAGARFFREAKVLSKFDHPNICRIYDLINVKGSQFLVMELVKGTTLTKFCEKGVDLKTKLDFALQITTGIAAAHEKNIVHRDLKPDNIMVTPDHCIKILDFGMAHSLMEQKTATDEFISNLSLSDFYREFTSSKEPLENNRIKGEIQEQNASLPSLDSDHFRTQVGKISGTPMYMSPEQAHGESGVHSCDMYSLGLIFQWMFTGKNPYSSNNPVELLYKALHADTHPVEGLGTDLTALINRLKSLSPGNRPTAQDVIKELKWIQAKPKRKVKRLTVSGVIMILVLGTAFSTWGFLRARQSEAKATRAREEAELVNEFLQNMLASPDPSVDGKEVKVIDVLDKAAEEVDVFFEDHQGNLSAIHSTLGWTYKGLGDYKKAHAHLSKALKLSKATYGIKHTQTFQVMSSLAVVSAMQGQSTEAEKLLREILSESKSFLPDDHEQILKVTGNLGLVLKDQGRNKEAELLFRKNLIQQKRVFGVESKEVLYAWNNLAISLALQGKNDEAEEFFYKSYAAKRKLLGEKHPSTIQSLDNLGLIYDFQGKLQEAEEIYAQSLAVRKEILGEEHPKTRETIHNIASLLLKQDKWEEALPLLQENYKVQSEILGENHIDTLISKTYIAKVLIKQEEYEKAENLFREALQSVRSVVGEDHPQIVTQLTELGICLAEQKKYSQAEKIFEEASILARKVMSRENPEAVCLMQGRAKCLLDSGKLDKAESLYQEIIDLQVELNGEMHPVTISEKGNMAKVYMKRNQHKEAEELYRNLILSSIEVNGENHIKTLDLKYGQGLALIGQNKHDEAAILFQQILPDITSTRGSEHAIAVDINEKLETCLKLQNEDNKSH